MPLDPSRRSRRLLAHVCWSLLLAGPACTRGDTGPGAPADTLAVDDPFPEWEPPIDGPTVTLAAEPLLPAEASRATGLRTLRGDAAHPLVAPADVELLGDGRVLVLDSGAGDVKLFDADGRLERVLGAAGTGPAAIGRGATNVFLVAADTALVVDPAAGQATRWPLDGAPGGVARLATHDGVSLGFRRDPRDGRVREAFVPLRPMPGERTRLEPALLVRPALQRDTASMLELPTGLDSTARLGTSAADPRVHWAIGEDGSVAVAHGRAYRVRIYERDGAPRLVLQRDSAAPGAGTAAFEALLAGPAGETWIRRAPDPDAPATAPWDVHDREGRWLAVVRLPAGFTLTRIAGRTLVGHGLDAGGEPVAQLLRVPELAPR